jgi:2-haloacid dehalogenase
MPQDRWATFDCYGTLIDWDAGIRGELERVLGGDNADEAELDALLRRYHEVEPEVAKDGRLSYREVMTETMRRLGAPEAEAGALAESLPGWEPFPEVREALEEVRGRGWRLAILSNSDKDLIEASKERIGVAFDETVVASEIQSYKPGFMHWLEFQARTLVDRRRHAHVAASAFHDVAPALKLRIPTVWINRLHEHPLTSPTRELPDLTDLPDTLDELIPE